MKIASIILALGASWTAMADIDTTLIGGRPARDNEFPEVIRISSGRSYCSASLISDRVIITAAHCTQDDGTIRPVSEKITYQFMFKQRVYKARCKIAPGYKERQGVGSQDLALCKTDKPVEAKYASVVQQGPKKGDRVTMAGYGCVRGESPRGGNDGVLRVGSAPVTKESTDESFHFYSEGSSAPCYGDSGGPVFKELSDPRSEHHYLNGIISMGNIKDLGLYTSVARSLDFLRDFEREQGVEICGLSRDCDGGKPEPRQCGPELDAVKTSVAQLDQCLSK